MATPEENKAELETLLDNFTINFHRFIQEKVGEYNGTALGVVSIGWGCYPSGGGGYFGYFGFRNSRDTMLLFEVKRMVSVDDIAFLEGFESGRGHNIRYVSTPKNLDQDPFGYRFPNILDKLDPKLDIPIDDIQRPLVEDVIKHIKGGEFWTIRKYAVQSGHRKGIYRNFKPIVENTFLTKPSLPAVMLFKESEFCVKEMPHEGIGSLVLHEESNTENKLSIPADQLNLDKTPWNFMGGGTIPVKFMMTPDLNPDVASNWTILHIGNYDFYTGRKPLQRNR